MRLGGTDLKLLQSRYRELSEREKHVIQLVASGMSNKLIANELGVSIRTVETQRAAAYRKLKVNNKASLNQLLSDLESGEMSLEQTLRDISKSKK